MKENNKKIISIIIIILLLPYILTVFIKGEGVFGTSKQTTEERVWVKVEKADSVEEITYDNYLLGILAKEIPQEYSLEAMKAQAIIIRTRLELEKSESNSDEYIFQESYFEIQDIQKKWSNADSIQIYTNLVEAVESTQHKILKYDGILAKTPYHLLNTGKTRNGNEVFLSEECSYLVSVPCPLDIESDKEVAIQTVTYEDIGKLLDITVDEELKFDDFKVLEADNANYALSVQIQDNVVSGEVFRERLFLKSSAFTFQNAGDRSLQITTQGVGHGLGLSQNTAHYMGLEGKTYEEILYYFYKGTEIITK